MADKVTTYYLNMEGNLIEKTKLVNKGFLEAATAAGTMRAALGGLATRFIGIAALITTAHRAFNML